MAGQKHIFVNRMRRQATDGEKIFAEDISIKDCCPKYFLKKALKIHSTIRKQTT